MLPSSLSLSSSVFVGVLVLFLAPSLLYAQQDLSFSGRFSSSSPVVNQPRFNPPPAGCTLDSLNIYRYALYNFTAPSSGAALITFFNVDLAFIYTGPSFSPSSLCSNGAGLFKAGFSGTNQVGTYVSAYSLTASTYYTILMMSTDNDDIAFGGTIKTAFSIKSQTSSPTSWSPLLNNGMGQCYAEAVPYSYSTSTYTAPDSASVDFNLVFAPFFGVNNAPVYPSSVALTLVSANVDNSGVSSLTCDSTFVNGQKQIQNRVSLLGVNVQAGVTYTIIASAYYVSSGNQPFYSTYGIDVVLSPTYTFPAGVANFIPPQTESCGADVICTPQDTSAQTSVAIDLNVTPNSYFYLSLTFAAGTSGIQMFLYSTSNSDAQTCPSSSSASGNVCVGSYTSLSAGAIFLAGNSNTYTIIITTSSSLTSFTARPLLITGPSITSVPSLSSTATTAATTNSAATSSSSSSSSTTTTATGATSSLSSLSSTSTTASRSTSSSSSSSSTTRVPSSSTSTGQASASSSLHYADVLSFIIFTMSSVLALVC